MRALQAVCLEIIDASSGFGRISSARRFTALEIAALNSADEPNGLKG
jgi:hypothetical protein